MVKSYLRWTASSTYGVLSSGAVEHVSPATLASCCLSAVGILSAKQGGVVRSLEQPPSADAAQPEATALARAPGGTTATRLAVGYSDGSVRAAKSSRRDVAPPSSAPSPHAPVVRSPPQIRLWNLSTGDAEVTLHGHKVCFSVGFGRPGVCFSLSFPTAALVTNKV